MGPATPFVTGSGTHFVGNEGIVPQKIHHSLLYLAKHTIFHQSKFIPGNFRRSHVPSKIRYLFKGAPAKTTVFSGANWTRFEKPSDALSLLTNNSNSSEAPCGKDECHEC